MIPETRAANKVTIGLSWLHNLERASWSQHRKGKARWTLDHMHSNLKKLLILVWYIMT